MSSIFISFGLSVAITLPDEPPGSVSTLHGSWLSPAGAPTADILLEVRRLEEDASGVPAGVTAVPEGFRVALPLWQMQIAVGPPVRVALEVYPECPLLPQLALQLMAFLVAPCFDSLFLHSGGVDWAGGALALCGPSGAGKTTACLDAPAGVRVLSDENILCTRRRGRWLAHATPFGSDDRQWPMTPDYRSLDAVILLERGRRQLLRAPAARGVPALLLCSSPLGGPLTEQILDLTTDLVRSVPCYQIFTEHPAQVWPTVTEALGGHAGERRC